MRIINEIKNQYMKEQQLHESLYYSLHMRNSNTCEDMENDNTKHYKTK
jgi:hypothetical protein